MDAWNTTYVGIIPQEYLQSRTYEEQQEKWRKRLFENNDTKEFMFVLENDDKQVVGFSTAMVNDKPSEIDSTLYTIYIDKDYQGKGLGKILIKAVMSELCSLGAKSMSLAALAENNSCKFYEHLGGKKVSEKIIDIYGAELIEVLYVWDDIASL